MDDAAAKGWENFFWVSVPAVYLMVRCVLFIALGKETTGFYNIDAVLAFLFAFTAFLSALSGLLTVKRKK